MERNEVIVGDCLEVANDLVNESFDLIYLDPPFFTQRHHELSTRDGSSTYSFSDVWASHHTYASFISERLHKLRLKLKPTGSIFFHCDKNSVHIVRWLLDEIFGVSNFQSEIIWTYRRWSNDHKGLLPAHQNILFYSKTNDFKFNQQFTGYSETTNLDQITQRRSRDSRNKAIYARDHKGDIIPHTEKRGVPLTDVWDIPLLNPKANERVGYPTQKPVLLLERIIQLCTDEGDWILDPFAGSGTTLVASKILNRNAIGIDVSSVAVDLANDRLCNPIKTRSNLLETGRSAYARKDGEVLEHLKGLDYFPVQRNKGIDAILTQTSMGKIAFVRVQRAGESIEAAKTALRKAAIGKGDATLILIVIEENDLLLFPTDHDVHLVKSTAVSLKAALGNTK